jgi:hypothetical protein
MKIAKNTLRNFLIALVLIILVTSCKKIVTPAPPTDYGNGICDIGESSSTCPGDCPPVNSPNLSASANGSNYSAVAYGTSLKIPATIS